VDYDELHRLATVQVGERRPTITPQRFKKNKFIHGPGRNSVLSAVISEFRKKKESNKDLKQSSASPFLVSTMIGKFLTRKDKAQTTK
jgi:hypothetical protein